MRKVITAALACAMVSAPTIAMANTMPKSGSFTQMEFDSEEDCEEARADERRSQSQGLTGRERGQFNKAFNQRFQCEQTEGEKTSRTSDDEFMIKDQHRS